VKINRASLGFILLTIGTAGLLVSEFLYDLGSGLVIVFAISNIIGLILVVRVLKG